jgi:uncharacterized protein YidB (DUF937 family)
LVQLFFQLQENLMGLLDSVLGAAGAMMGNQQQQGGALGGLGGLGALLPVVAGMLGNDSQHGGLGGLLEKFNQAGLGDVAKSWVGTGENAPISGDQLGQVLGGDAMSEIAAKLGMNQGDAAGSLAQMLPGLIDKLTPHGQAPAGGLGNAGDLMGMLGGLLNKN